MSPSPLICESTTWRELKEHVEDIKKTHLRDLMSDTQRCKSMMVEFDVLLLDYSRQRATIPTMDKLFKFAEEAHLKEKINKMFNGEHINSTENRSVLHVALSAPRDTVIQSDGKNVVPDLWAVLDFSEKIRKGSWVTAGTLLLGPSAKKKSLAYINDLELENARLMAESTALKLQHHQQV